MSFNIALSGIQAATSELDVVGNNIANAGTTGFKSSRTKFSDVYAASSLGTSALAIGSGTRLASVDQMFTQGNVNFTSNNLDLAINGQGFFKLNEGGTSVFTRAGSFRTDESGYIVNSIGAHLTGYLADNTGQITGASGDLHIDNANIPPTGTTKVNMGINLQSTAPVPPVAWVGSPNFGDAAPSPDTYNNATTTTIYDSLGNSHLLNLYYIKTGNPNEWQVRGQVDGVDVDAAPAAAPFNLKFNPDGSFDIPNSDPIDLSWDPLNSAGVQNGATSPQKFHIDLAASTQFGSPFGVQSLSQNGAATGRLDSIDVSANGVIFGRYSNGQSRAMGQVTLSNFTNPNGLQPLGDTKWGETFSSGTALTGEPGSASLGNVQSGALEDSNVDLTAELVEMIVAQRNYQANAQTIKTSDAVTQTIINIR